MTPKQLAAATEAVIRANTRYAKMATRYGVDLEDLAQSALEEIVKAAPKWDGSGEFQAFAYRVAIRKIAEQVRAQAGVVRQNPRNHKPFLEIRYAEPAEHGEEHDHETHCSTESPVEEISRMRHAVIHAELTRAFGPRCEEAARLLSAGGYEEYARTTGASRQAIYERAQRMIRVLKGSPALRALWEEL